ncbi:MAG: tetratricopeptide repeat protein [Bdellovibrionales bacterium]
MTEVNSELVEKYQLMLQSDPKAKIFAPLAEAYRRMGLIDEGIQVCLKGLSYHPSFASGRVALGRLYLDKENPALAAEQLQQAVELSPENILAQGLLGETYLKLRRPKEALAAFKMLMFLSPTDEKALKMVRKLESLTADEYDEDVFAMSRLHELGMQGQNLEIEEAEPLKPLDNDAEQERQRRGLERFLSLADAFLVRNDFEKAQQTLENAEKIHGLDPQITRRLKILKQRFLDEGDPLPNIPIPSREQQLHSQKTALLTEFLGRIESRRRNS